MSQSDNQKDFFYRVYHKVKGSEETNHNDLILFKSKKFKAEFNVIFFGGDVQDYEEQMLKSFTAKHYTHWSLTNTGNVIFHKFLNEVKQSSVNLFIIRPSFYHLKTFANYSNFVPSNDFGAPLDEDDLKSLESANAEPKTKAWSHLKALVENGANLFNSDFVDYKIDHSLPIILCGFSKGCVVLNQLCKEIHSDLDQARRVKYCIWLDGGHCGSAEAWLTDEKAIQSIKELDWTCLVYTTPYQMRVSRHVEDYLKFIEISKCMGVRMIKRCYFEEESLVGGAATDDTGFQLETHFRLLSEFDTTEIR